MSQAMMKQSTCLRSSGAGVKNSIVDPTVAKLYSINVNDRASIRIFKVCSRSRAMPPVMMKKIMKVATPMYP
jgi:hypothetical protein